MLYSFICLLLVNIFGVLFYIVVRENMTVHCW